MPGGVPPGGSPEEVQAVELLRNRLADHNLSLEAAGVGGFAPIMPSGASQRLKLLAAAAPHRR